MNHQIQPPYNFPYPTESQPLPPPPPPPESEFGCATVLVRHLPEAIPFDTLSRLFSHYGASSVRPCTHGRVRNCAFVDFQSEVGASQAQRQLNGLRFLGKVLSVEIANKGMENKSSQQGEAQPGSGPPGTGILKDSTEGLKLGSYPAHEPIAERLGVDYPFPPQLEYAYPPPDGNILTNIVNALIAVPRFYTQVLHLMNKMNIPAPFRIALPTPPLPTQVPVSPPPAPSAPYPESLKTNLEHISTSESEMESSEEDAAGHRSKRMKRESIVGPAIDKGVAHEAVGLRSAALVPKEIPVIKKKNSVLQIKIAPKKIHNEQVDDIATMDLPLSDSASLNQTIVTPEELKNGRMPPEEILSLPMFKNYTAGNPTPVLYVKNLAKDVVAEDFYYLFGSLFGSIDMAKSCINVKLMKEGRMKGQAFITFPSVELAQNALNLVNGYVFKGKPIVIQFGRNTAPAKAN
ncbi:hypothetical protein Leryth_012264 [Lithospermum erythrorhizon]|nr:hypothetical protein Leryth_012264 [Lithospermum erythrorhizon]